MSVANIIEKETAEMGFDELELLVSSASSSGVAEN